MSSRTALGFVPVGLLLSLEKKWAAFLPGKEKKTWWGIQGVVVSLKGTVPSVSEIPRVCLGTGRRTSMWEGPNQDKSPVSLCDCLFASALLLFITLN